ncbi:MAG: cache domain-containing protein [Hormoscilla sp. GUM202]|nr:cache domain-containing protein [Hormoscilla sp. GUM202]
MANNCSCSKWIKQKLPGQNQRTLSWYRLGADGGSKWSEVYRVEATGELAIAAVLPLYDDRERLLGVAKVDLLLSGIDDFLDGFTIGRFFGPSADRSGQSFIIERSGELLLPLPPRKSHSEWKIG